ncbi:helix-turn-helix domain-containing protein [Dactylosporangium sp. CA-233914]|uniref:helix-turn-helix domain-containing protein n=1 Tax=Dactylosporangium sp. CA-233914 TaxID=3239934 RepID=UPI003D8CD8CA
MSTDSRFPALLRELRQQRGLSLRTLARQVNYSHTYLWELEVGRKQPTHAAADALDTALGGDGQLAALVAEPAIPAPRPPATPEELDDLREQLAHAAQTVAAAPGSAAAAQCSGWKRRGREGIRVPNADR